MVNGEAQRDVHHLHWRWRLQNDIRELEEASKNEYLIEEDRLERYLPSPGDDILFPCRGMIVCIFSVTFL